MFDRCVREAFFAEVAGRSRFCLVTRPTAGVSPRGGLLLVPPFAEELNKSRRMISLAIQEFAADGWSVFQLDLLGCGDSAGDFGDAGWDDWIADIDLGWRALRDRVGGERPCVLWSLRGGSLLAADWLLRGSVRPPWLMWQPVMNGKQHLTQFLRLKAASEMLNDADARKVMARIRAQLDAGESVEVAGYTIASALASGMDASVLCLPEGHVDPVMALEVSAVEQGVVSPAVAMAVDKWRAAGVRAEVEVVPGLAFWQTQEIEIASALLAPSQRFLAQVVA